MLAALLFLVAGFVLLIKGADWLIEGACSIAKRFGVSDLAIGLTLVAFGTSAPELVVNIVASAQGAGNIAIGNALGSNIANILLILGASAALAPIVVQRSTVRKEIPFSLLAALMLFVMANDVLIDHAAQAELTRGDGLALIGFFLLFLAYTFGIQQAPPQEETTKLRAVGFSALLVIVGLGAMSAGGKLAVDAAVTIAADLGVSESLIGLTVVAVGTSLPELATSVVAATRGKADIAVGNIVGSNIFNIFFVLGVSAIIRPLPFPQSANADLLVVMAATILLFFLIHNGWMARRLLLWWKQRDRYIIRRWEGAIMLLSYAAYLGFVGWRG